MAACHAIGRAVRRLPGVLGWFGVAALLATPALGAPPAAQRVADTERAPRFSLEQLATHRSPGQFVLSPDRRSVVHTHVARDRAAAWSPDGTEITFASARWGRPALYVMAATGERNGLRQVTPDGFGGLNQVWSPDGEYILFIASRDEHFYPPSGSRRATMPATTGRPSRPTAPGSRTCPTAVVTSTCGK